MTTYTLANVAEYPARSGSGDRLLFTSTAMWVAYTATNTALTLSSYPRLTINGLLGSPSTSTIIATLVPRWVDPEILVFGSLIAVVYQNGDALERSLNVALVDQSGIIRDTITLGSGIRYEIPFACLIDGSGNLAIYAGYRDYLTHEFSSLVCHTVSASTVSVTSVVIGNYFGSISSLIVSKDTYDVPGHIIFSNKESLYKYSLTDASPTPVLLHTCPIGVIVEATATSNYGDTAVLFSTIVNGKPLSPNLFHIFNTNPATSLRFQSGEALSHCRIIYTGSNQYKLYAVTQNISAHPRSVFSATINNIMSLDPSYDNIEYQYPLGLRSLGLEFGQNLLTESDSLNTHIRSGSLLLENPGSTDSMLCYFDPYTSPISFTVGPSSISNQARGSQGTPAEITASVSVVNQDGIPLQYSWTSSTQEITFSSPYEATTQVYFSYLTPDTASIYITLFYNGTSSSKTIPVAMIPHEKPNISPISVTTDWHATVSIPINVSHDPNYPVTLTCSTLVDIALSPEDSNLTRGNLSCTILPSSSLDGVTYTLWAQPWHVNILGDTYPVSLTATDPLCSVSITGLLKVNYFNPLYLGQGYLQRFAYNGTLRTANEGMDFTNTNSASSLTSDFTDVRRLLFNGILYFIFFGSHSVLWISNWVTWAHLYQLSYDPIVDSTINIFGQTAILTQTEVLIYNDPVTGILANTSGNTLGLPYNMTYQDVPTSKITLPASILGNALSIKETSVSGLWLVATDRSVGVLRSSGFEVFSPEDMSIGTDDTIYQIYVTKLEDYFNGYFIVFVRLSLGSFIAIHVSLSDRSCRLVWQGDSLASFISI